MASFNGPKLTNPIRTDVPEIQEVLVALAKQDPTPISDTPSGAKRLYEVSSGKWQWQAYNGTSWAPVPFLQHNVDQLDGYHAAITPAANTVAVRNASGVLEDSITGNAATASSAATLSQTLPVSKGGTGATTSAAARINLGVPPTSHASTATTYGVGNASQYGHVKLSDAANSLSGVSGGVAATPAAVKAAKDAADNAQSSADAAMTKASTLATSSTPGIVQLSSATNSESEDVAATSKAVKVAHDKAVEASNKANLPLGHIFAWPFSTPPDGSIQLNGSTYSRELYSDLWNLIKAKGWYKSEDEWQSIASANGGYCPWYSGGDGSTTFRTPKFAPYQKIALASGDVGKYHEAGLPNITGKSWSTTWNGFTDVSYGAFYSTIENPSATIGSTVTADYNNDWWNFDASRSNPIYGNSTTVTPESHDWIICAVAFGTATNVGSVDVANVMSAIGQVQAAVGQVQAAVEQVYPVGSLFASFDTSMQGCLLCNGAAVSRTTYADLFALLNTAFGKGDGSKTFKLPDFRDKTLWGANGNLKSILAAGLPNFSGKFWAYTVGWSDASGTGPFYNLGAAGTPGNRGGEGGSACTWGFNPARVSSVYGNSSTVQPPAIAVNIFIKY